VPKYMAKQRYINTRFWDDGYIVTLDPIEKLLFLYFLTNPLTEISGAYEIPLRRIAFDTGIDRDMVLKIVARFAEEDKIIYQDGWVLVCNFIKHQSANPKITKGIELSVSGCPDWIKDRLCIAYDRLSHLNSNSNTNLNIKERTVGYASPPDFDPEETRSRPPLSRAAATPASAQLDVWLNTIATTLGAKDSNGLPKLKKWEQVCMTAIREKHNLASLLKVIESESKRTKGQEQYFSPDTCLQKLQANGFSPKQSKWTHDV
jgi:hypothetical protein